MVITSYSDAFVFDNDGNKVKEFHGGGDHFRNFIDAMRSRKRGDQNGEIEEGHLSSALCHLGNISYRLGTPQPFNKKTNAFGDNKEAVETLGRMEEHLKENSVALDGETYLLGPKLKINPSKEAFVGNDKANLMLTREYRKPFVVPDKV